MKGPSPRTAAPHRQPAVASVGRIVCTYGRKSVLPVYVRGIGSNGRFGDRRSCCCGDLRSKPQGSRFLIAGRRRYASVQTPRATPARIEVACSRGADFSFFWRASSGSRHSLLRVRAAWDSMPKPPSVAAVGPSSLSNTFTSPSGPPTMTARGSPRTTGPALSSVLNAECGSNAFPSAT